MAIKGKSKSRGTKAVTRGPKPAYVPVKTPLLRRRGLWIAVGAVLAAGLLAAIVAGLVQQRNQTREEERLERMVAAVGEYRRAVEPVLSTVGQSVPPTGFTAFPNLASSIAGLEDDEVSPGALEAAAADAEAAAETAETAAGIFGEIDATEFVRGRELPADFVLNLLNSRDGFAQAMNLYREAAVLTSMAVEAEEGPARDDLVASARGVHDAAASLFAQAYGDYVEVQAAAGTLETTAGLPTLPAATGPTG
ncbi:MAG: hypothetical protein ACRDHU_12885 [Actinomycetota bacterium]